MKIDSDLKHDVEAELRSDTDIARNAEQALEWNTSVALDRLQISVDHGWVTLRGKVNSWHERDAAQGVAWSTPGVRTVINELSVDSAGPA